MAGLCTSVFALLHVSCMRVLVQIGPSELAATAQANYALGAGGSRGDGYILIAISLCQISDPAVFHRVGFAGRATAGHLGTIPDQATGFPQRASDRLKDS